MNLIWLSSKNIWIDADTMRLGQDGWLSFYYAEPVEGKAEFLQAKKRRRLKNNSTKPKNFMVYSLQDSTWQRCTITQDAGIQYTDVDSSRIKASIPATPVRYETIKPMLDVFQKVKSAADIARLNPTERKNLKKALRHLDTGANTPEARYLKTLCGQYTDKAFFIGLVVAQEASERETLAERTALTFDPPGQEVQAHIRDGEHLYRDRAVNSILSQTTAILSPLTTPHYYADTLASTGQWGFTLPAGSVGNDGFSDISALDFQRPLLNLFLHHGKNLKPVRFAMPVQVPGHWVALGLSLTGPNADAMAELEAFLEPYQWLTEEQLCFLFVGDKNARSYANLLQQHKLTDFNQTAKMTELTAILSGLYDKVEAVMMDSSGNGVRLRQTGFTKPLTDAFAKAKLKALPIPQQEDDSSCGVFAVFATQRYVETGAAFSLGKQTGKAWSAQMRIQHAALLKQSVKRTKGSHIPSLPKRQKTTDLDAGKIQTFPPQIKRLNFEDKAVQKTVIKVLKTFTKDDFEYQKTDHTPSFYSSVKQIRLSSNGTELLDIYDWTEGLKAHVLFTACNYGFTDEQLTKNQDKPAELKRMLQGQFKVRVNFNNPSDERNDETQEAIRRYLEENFGLELSNPPTSEPTQTPTPHTF